MSTKSTFVINNDFDVTSALEQAQCAAEWQSNPPESYESTYYDSFDWRLHNASSYLVLEKSLHALSLNWCDKDGDRIRQWANVEEPPDFVCKLAEGALKDALGPVLDVRRLLPYIRIKHRTESYVLLNEDKKIVLRVAKDSTRAINPQTGKSKALIPRLHVQALKGYAKPYKEFIRYLRLQYKLKSASAPFNEAITAHDITPGDYSSKLKLKLDPEIRSDAAVKRFLQQLLAVMERNEAGIEADWDSEFLHDFRVAVRRSRSIIGQIKQVMPVRVLNKLQHEYAWLNQVSGPSRDMDVYLLNFPDYQASLAEDIQGDLAPLEQFLRDHKQTEYKKLVRALHSARYRNFKQYVGKYIDAPVSERTTLAHAKQSITEVSGQRIWRFYRRVMKEGKAISNSSPNEALHELRKSCKKLRYLLEFCRSVYAKKDVDRLIKALKQLQDNLGEFQDFSVQIHALQQFSQQMVEEKRASEGTLLAMDSLIAILQQRQAKVRKLFHQRFKQFSGKENEAIFQRLFRPANSGKGLEQSQVVQ